MFPIPKVSYYFVWRVEILRLQDIQGRLEAEVRQLELSDMLNWLLGMKIMTVNASCTPHSTKGKKVKSKEVWGQRI